VQLARLDVGPGKARSQPERLPLSGLVSLPLEFPEINERFAERAQTRGIEQPLVGLVTATSRGERTSDGKQC